MSKHLLLVTFQLLTMSNSFSNLIKWIMELWSPGQWKYFLDKNIPLLKYFCFTRTGSTIAPPRVPARPGQSVAVHCHSLPSSHIAGKSHWTSDCRRALTGSASKILLGSWKLKYLISSQKAGSYIALSCFCASQTLIKKVSVVLPSRSEQQVAAKINVIMLDQCSTVQWVS